MTDFFFKTDPEVWTDFQNGRKNAFSFIYDKYSPELYNYGRHISQDEELVKDCIQDLFIEIWLKKEKLGEVHSIKFYLFQSLRRKLLNHLNKKKKSFENTLFHFNEDFEIVFSHESNLIQEQITKEEKENLLKAINTLSKRQKEVIFLKFYSCLSYKEIASVMDLNINSTYNVMSKAIDILNRKLKPLNSQLYAR